MTPQAHQQLARISSRTMFIVCTLFAAAILLLLVLVTGYLISIGFSSISLSLFAREPTADPAHPGGMLNGLAGTGVLIVLASLIGIPIGMLSGVYLAEYDSESYLARPVRFIADVLAGVPSIVVGVLGYELLVVPLGTFNAFAGAAALAFIMIPIVCRTTEEMLRLVPNSYREAAIALGATRSRTILRVVLPSATGSVVTGIMLAIARIAGETAPLLFTALYSFYLPRRPGDLDHAFPSLTVQIFNYATGPSPELKRQAWAGILVLITLIFFFESRDPICDAGEGVIVDSESWTLSGTVPDGQNTNNLLRLQNPVIDHVISLRKRTHRSGHSRTLLLYHIAVWKKLQRPERAQQALNHCIRIYR